MKNRIRELREEKGLKQVELAGILGVRQNTLSTWETGRYEPDNEMLQKIADYFDVSVDYLLRKSPIKQMPTSSIDMFRITRLMRTIEPMTPAQFDSTVQAAEEILSGASQNRNVGIRIPVLGDVAAGIPIEAIQDIVDYEEIDSAMAASGEYFGLRIKGSSMEPRMRDGDVVIVRKQDYADTGDTAVVLVNGDSATVKKIKKGPDGISLIPTNPAYDPMYYTAAEVESLPVRIIGRVVELRAKY